MVAGCVGSVSAELGCAAGAGGKADCVRDVQQFGTIRPVISQACDRVTQRHNRTVRIQHTRGWSSGYRCCVGHVLIALGIAVAVAWVCR